MVATRLTCNGPPTVKEDRMKKSKSLIGLTCFLCFIGILLIMTFNSNSQNLGRPKSPEIDFKNFPIASFDEPSPTEPQARDARKIKNKKFNSDAKAISESSTQIFTLMDWDVVYPLCRLTGVLLLSLEELLRQRLICQTTRLRSTPNLRCKSIPY